MKKILPSLVLLLLLVACTGRSEANYVIISTEPVDGYDIYQHVQTGLFCNTEFEDIYYSGETYNYGFSFKGCNPDMSFFIKKNDEYVYLQEAITNHDIILDDLIPQLEPLERHPEEFESDKADYYWLDFHINHQVVYAYAGGTCDQAMSEEFVIDNTTYIYSASGCMKDHILYMEQGDNYVTVASLLADGKIDGKYLIPLLTIKP